MSELREAIEQAVEQEGSEQGFNEAQPQQAPEKVLPVSSEGAKSPASVPSDTAKPVEASPPSGDTPASVARNRVDRPPQSWTAGSKALWADLPLEVRQEAHKRESEIMRGLSSAKPAQELAQSFGQITAPHQQWLEQSGYGTPMQFLNNALNLERVMITGTMREKVNLTADLLMNYGIDLEDLDAALTSRLTNKQDQRTSGDADFKHILARELEPLKRQLSEYQQRDQSAAQEMQSALQEDIETFSQAHDYFEELSEEMADFIDVATKHGKAMSLDQAYARAMASHPEFQTSSTNTNAQLVNRVKQTGLSISGVPRAAGQGINNNQISGSLRDQISAAFSNTAI